MRPQTPLGSPSPESFVQLSPPSTDFQRLLPGPPLSRLHGVRWACQNPAKSTRGFVASIARSTAPVLSSTNRTFCQVAPPSFERKTPRSAFGPNVWPSAATYTRSGFGRMHAHAPDLARVLEADALPGLARVHGLVDPVAVRDVAADAALAHPHVDDVGIGGGDLDRPHRSRAHLAVRQGLPVDPRVGGLPDAAPGGPHVVDARLTGHPRDRGDAPAPVGADAPPLQALQQRFVVGGERGLDRGRRLRLRSGNGRDGEEGERAQQRLPRSHGTASDGMVGRILHDP